MSVQTFALSCALGFSLTSDFRGIRIGAFNNDTFRFCLRSVNQATAAGVGERPEQLRGVCSWVFCPCS
jgi:hypothetical protein